MVRKSIDCFVFIYSFKEMKLEAILPEMHTAPELKVHRIWLVLFGDL